jgi:Arc/MetJ-type ribon-helix-helix transcriptional regulator
MAQLVTRIDETLAESMDALIAQGAASSRSELVRMGLERLIDEHQRMAIGLQIVDAYTETPQTDAENSELDAATRALILEEPW